MLKRRTVMWISRHEMTEDQKKDLESIYGDCWILKENHTWQATASYDDDTNENQQQWRWYERLIGVDGVIAGVFPPVAIEAMPVTDSITILTPISAQHESLRQDGSTKIEFAHVRWAKLR